MAVWNRLQSLIFGGAIGAAARTAIEPQIEPARQEAWANNRNRVLGVNELARLVAQGLTDEGAAADQAGRTGYDSNKLAALAQLQLVAPPVAEALTLRRRGRISDAQLRRSFAKAQIEPQFWDAIAELLDERLDPATSANAVQQGFIPGAGLLPPDVSGPPFDIPVEQVNIDTIAEFEAFGMNSERAKVLAELSGNPPSPEQLAEMVLRGQIPESGYFTGIREGRTKTKWASALLYYLTHPRLTPGLVINLLLRGWIDKAEADRRLSAYGYTSQQVQDWFDSAGRPMAPVQAFTAFFRGAPSPKGGVFDKQDFVDAIRRSDIRPEYTEPLWGIRYAYPSLFQLRGAVQAGAITPARALTILKYERYEDQDAQALVGTWEKGGTAKSKAETKAELADEFETGFISETEYRQALTDLGYTGHEQDLEVIHSTAAALKTERNRAIVALNKLYINHSLDDATATADLTQLGMTQDFISRALPIWALERDAQRKQLTAAQIRTAYRKNLLTQAVALADLEERGYSLVDATTYLES